jgi:hypothetical protein
MPKADSIAPEPEQATISLAPKPYGSGKSKAIIDGTPSFEARIVELQEYYDEHGHLRVSRTYTCGRSNSLGYWVKHLRNAYRGLLPHPTRLGEESPGSVMARNKLSKLRIERLEAMGFEWSLALRSEWEEHFQDLVEFQVSGKRLLSPLITAIPMLFPVSCVRFFSYCLRKSTDTVV